MRSSTKKRTIQIAGGIFLAVIIAGAGFLAGSYEPLEKGEGSIVEKIIHKEPGGIETEQIAVVNLDNGTLVNGTPVNYAAGLLGGLGENFVVTGLEDARQGLEAGKYGAYIILPGTFSEFATSLNKTPQKTQIEYEVGEGLKEEYKEKVILDTVAFTNKLSHDLSYMYINSILEEFHDTQDGAVTVMNNDVADRDVILNIRPVDLTELVPVPELTRSEPNENKLQISEYISKNEELVATVNDQYTQYIGISKADFEALGQEGEQLLEQWGMMGATLEGIDLTRNEQGKPVQEEGVELANVFMDAYNTSIGNKEDELSAATRRAVQELQTIQNTYGSVKAGYNQVLTEQKIPEALTAVTDQYNIPEVIAGEGELFVGETPISIPYLQNPEEVPDESVADYEEKWKARISILENYVNWSEVYITYLEQFLPEGELPEEGAISEFLPDQEAMVKTGYEAWSTEEGGGMLGEVRQYALSREFCSLPFPTIPPQELDITQFSEDLSGALGLELDQDGFSEEVNVILTDTFTEFDDRVRVPEETGERETTVSQMMADETERLKKQEELGGSLISSFDKEGLQGIIQTNVVEPFVGQTEKVKKTLLVQYGKEKKEYDSYHRALSEYNPLAYINQAEIRGTVAQMHENGSTMQKDILEYSTKEKEYVGKVYQDSTENTSLLVKNIAESTKKSQEAVSRGLSDAQGLKAENSAVNQELLQGITQKLPYTRLGSVEYTQAYEFIASPLIVSKKETTGKTVKTPEPKAAAATAGTQPRTEVKEGLSQGQVMLVLAMILVVILMVVFLAIKRMQRHEKNNPWGM